MGEIKPVSLKFSLDLNNKIGFSSFVGTGRIWKSNIGCVPDIIFLDLYTNEIERIQIPNTLYDQTSFCREWVNSIGKIKETALKWKKNIRPQIQKLIYILQGQSDFVINTLNDTITLTNNIMDRLKNGKPTELLYQNFIENINELLRMLNTRSEMLNDFEIFLNDYSYLLTEKNQQLEALSEKADFVTVEQRNWLDKIQKDLKIYRKSRKYAISGACLNGVLPSAEIIGGTMTVHLSDKMAVTIGATCFFGGIVSKTGMGISTIEAIGLKNKISAVKKKQTRTENEIMVKNIIETQFGLLAEQTEDLTQKVRKICADRIGILSAVKNIQVYVQSANGQLLPNEWEDIQNDLTVIRTVERILDKTVAKAAVETKIRTGYNLTGCRTQKEVIGKLIAFAEKQNTMDIASCS